MKYAMLMLATMILTTPSGLHAQQPPQFDVASVKPSAPAAAAAPGYIRAAPGGQRYVAFRAPLRFMILVAYQLHRDQLAIHDSWINTELYDIDARTEGHPSRAELRAMLQNLLADRFHLRLEREAKDGPMYALVVDRGGVKMQRHDPQNAGDTWIDNKSDPEPARQLKTDWHATSSPMEYVAWRLTQTLDHPVVDKTGLEGGYDFDLAFTMPLPLGMVEGAQVNGVTMDTSGPSVFDAIRGLGLRLERARGPVEGVTVAHAERPSGN